ncbi:hypothetical protein FNV43_RR15489 [Rhamnella rubrinervis]|uniref:RING-type domain-containing protein n=1 Tax=Rhamnella rubrinervis TaxID=2594499 RepID=A0A8K0E1W3_9ROSA|nr:hypothetical protein FNV43_RR15489 [Rhamnella rubrinervis]
MVNDNTNTFGKAICSICYEDLLPIVEDLQVVSICGHVFHELCLQQWFEYCSSTKKHSCPVCKQRCKADNAIRLYFQSVGDSADPSITQKLVADCEGNPEALRREVKRLESKVVGLGSALESQSKAFKELNEEFCLCKEQAQKEIAMKNEASKQLVSSQLLLHMKNEELNKSTLECSRLQERNMALAKELAAFKLVTDVDLDEEEVLKLASFGNGANNKDTIDVLRKSLVMRNRSYKELMAKCNLLGRGEARSSKMLEKAKEKINKLKSRVEELEIVVEVKDNEALKALKASTRERVSDDVNCKTYSFASNNASEDQRKQFSAPMLNLEETANLTYESSHPQKTKNINFNNVMDTTHTKVGMSSTILGKRKDAISLLDEDDSKLSTPMCELPSPDLKHQAAEDVAAQKSTLPISKAASDMKKEILLREPSNLVGPLGIGTSIDNTTKNFAVNVDEDVALLHDSVTHVEPVLNIRKESIVPSPLSNPGDVCFSGGLLGPDGTNRYLGKWCKRGQNKELKEWRKGLSSNTGDLIAVGADGKGGRVKVLRSLNQSTLCAVPIRLDFLHNIFVVANIKHASKIFRNLRRLQEGQRRASLELGQIVCNPKAACKLNTSLEGLATNIAEVHIEIDLDSYYNVLWPRNSENCLFTWSSCK